MRQNAPQRPPDPLGRTSRRSAKLGSSHHPSHIPKNLFCPPLPEYLDETVPALCDDDMAATALEEVDVEHNYSKRWCFVT